MLQLFTILSKILAIFTKVTHKDWKKFYGKCSPENVNEFQNFSGKFEIQGGKLIFYQSLPSDRACYDKTYILI